MPALRVEPVEETYTAYNAAADLFEYEGPEVVLSGPANTGKSRACLEKLNWLAATTPGFRGLILRKTLASLKGSGLVTFDEKVHPERAGAVFHGDTGKRPPQYTYPNGAVIVIGGLDKPLKVMSSDYDVIYVQEATELTLAEWEALTTRCRTKTLHYQQLMGDCNPDAPTHWLLQRAQAGTTLVLESRHEDNPTCTPADIARLDALTGVRKLRLRYGIWAAAEGMVYQDAWDPARNLIQRFSLPREWPRYLVIDFGFSHPFVCQWWAEDGDGRLFLYREIYMTRRLVEDHARQIVEVSHWGEPEGDPLPYAIICDHDAEDRATLEKHLGLAYQERLKALKRSAQYRAFNTTPAQKEVSPGIQAVASRLKAAGDGKARLYFLRDSLVERDPVLVEAHWPTSTVEEFPSYILNPTKDAPIKDKDHGQDACRYMCAHRDFGPGVPIERIRMFR